jgi:hypothetical protein
MSVAPLRGRPPAAARPALQREPRGRDPGATPDRAGGWPPRGAGHDRRRPAGPRRSPSSRRPRRGPAGRAASRYGRLPLRAREPGPPHECRRARRGVRRRPARARPGATHADAPPSIRAAAVVAGRGRERPGSWRPDATSVARGTHRLSTSGVESRNPTHDGGRSRVRQRRWCRRMPRRVRAPSRPPVTLRCAREPEVSDPRRGSESA